MKINKRFAIKQIDSLSITYSGNIATHSESRKKKHYLIIPDSSDIEKVLLPIKRQEYTSNT